MPAPGAPGATERGSGIRIVGAWPALAGFQRAWLFGLAALWLLQTGCRLYFFAQAGWGTGLRAVLLHGSIVFALWCALALLLACLALGGAGRGTRAMLAAAILGFVHALLTLFDAIQVISYDLAGTPIAMSVITKSPLLLLSLLDNVGIGVRILFGTFAAVLVAHVLLYVPVRHALLASSASAVRSRLSAGRFALPIGLLLLAGIGLAALQPKIPARFREGEPFFQSSRRVFQTAPQSLMARPARAPTPAEPDLPLPSGSRPLVLIIVDTLRSDLMGIYNPPLGNTPFLSGLHAQGRLSRFNAYSTCTFSFCGIMSIFSSRSWNSFGTRPETIADLLGRHSYDSHLLLAGQYAKFGSLLRLLGGDVVTMRDQAPSTQASDTWLLGELERLRLANPRQSFLYLHMMSGHVGAFIEPRFRATADDDGRIGASLFSRGAKAAYRKTYDRRVRQTDDVLRRIFVILERKGILKDALVIITSDHGERVAEGGMLYHGGDADPPTLNIPMLIYDSRGLAYPPRELASQIDVAPTLAAAIGLAPSPAWMGQPLQRRIARSAVPVGTWESTGAVIRNGSDPILYLCDRSTGAESVVPFSGKAPADGTGDIASYRRLHRLVAAPVTDRPCIK